ncbi:hypothetical protein ACFQX6_66405 [Streptosporangium lutulentum]
MRSASLTVNVCAGEGAAEEARAGTPVPVDGAETDPAPQAAASTSAPPMPITRAERGKSAMIMIVSWAAW